MKLNTYLNFNGNCEDALKFYEKALGAKPVMMMRYGESPVAKETAKEMHQKILHGRVTLGENVIMASDAPPGRFRGQSGFCINIGVDTPEEAERLFNALSEKAEICMPFAETFWALRFGTPHAIFRQSTFALRWLRSCKSLPSKIYKSSSLESGLGQNGGCLGTKLQVTSFAIGEFILPDANVTTRDGDQTPLS